MRRSFVYKALEMKSSGWDAGGNRDGFGRRSRVDVGGSSFLAMRRWWSGKKRGRQANHRPRVAVPGTS